MVECDLKTVWMIKVPSWKCEVCEVNLSDVLLHKENMQGEKFQAIREEKEVSSIYCRYWLVRQYVGRNKRDESITRLLISASCILMV